MTLDARRINTNGEHLELGAQKMLLLFFRNRSKFSVGERVSFKACNSHQHHAFSTAGITVMCLASSSHSWHECDDRAERIELIRVKVHVRTMPVEQLAIARQLAAERPQLADVPALRLHVHR